MLKEGRRLKNIFREQHATFNPFIMLPWGEHTLVLFGLKILGGERNSTIANGGDYMGRMRKNEMLSDS